VFQLSGAEYESDEASYVTREYILHILDVIVGNAAEYVVHDTTEFDVHSAVSSLSTSVYTAPTLAIAVDIQQQQQQQQQLEECIKSFECGFEVSEAFLSQTYTQLSVEDQQYVETQTQHIDKLILTFQSVFGAANMVELLPLIYEFSDNMQHNKLQSLRMLLSLIPESIARPLLSYAISQRLQLSLLRSSE